MGSFARRLRKYGAIPLGCALTALCAARASAQSELKLFTPGSFEVIGDVRLVAVDGEKSWVAGGFGKLRSGSEGDLRAEPQLGNASLVWKPQFTWSLGATIVGSVQGGPAIDLSPIQPKPIAETSEFEFPVRRPQCG